MTQSSHSNPNTEVAATVVVVAVESALSSFSALIVVGVKVLIAMVAVECGVCVAFLFSCAYLLVPVHVVVILYVLFLGSFPTWTCGRLPKELIPHPAWTWWYYYHLCLDLLLCAMSLCVIPHSPRSY